LPCVCLYTTTTTTTTHPELGHECDGAHHLKKKKPFWCGIILSGGERRPEKTGEDPKKKK
jgi:hypothetical protein